MMWLVRGVIFVYLVVLFSLQANAEGKEKSRLSLFANIDFVSRHSWRGGLEGNALAIEPTVELGYRKFAIGMWAAATIDDEYKELDIYLSYFPVKGLTLSLFDYYCPPQKLSEAKFSDFKTWHLLDAIIMYNFEKIPLKLTCATVIGGMDDEYSTYLEAMYTFPVPIGKNNEVIALVAGTPYKGIYASKADFVNTELIMKHTFNFNKGKFSMPIYGRLIYNPHRNKTYFIVGVSIAKLLLL